jgi:hypothetical protein
VNGRNGDPADFELLLEPRPPLRALERPLGCGKNDVRTLSISPAFLDRHDRDELRHPSLEASASRTDERDEGDCDEESGERTHRDHSGRAAPEEICEGAPDHFARAVGPLGARVGNRSDAVESLHLDGDVNLLAGVGVGAVAEQVLARQLGAEPLENRLQIVSGLRLGILPAGSAGELAKGARVERARLKADREDTHAGVTSLRSCVLEGREASRVGAVGEDDDGAHG